MGGENEGSHEGEGGVNGEVEEDTVGDHDMCEDSGDMEVKEGCEEENSEEDSEWDSEASK